jgi:hypothetical protein
MPEWALGSFLLDEQEERLKATEYAGFNARVGARFFSPVR